MTTVLDINQFVYQTGALTIAPGDTTAVFTGAAIASGPARDGDWLFAGGTISVLKTIVDDGEAELFVPWSGAAVTAGPYMILKASLLRYAPALAAVDSGELIAMLNLRQIFYNVPGSVPDPSIGKEGDFAIKTNSGAWLLWKFLSGAWELQATPVGANWRGQWDDDADYVVNDTAGRLGSTYISKSINTNKPPESNPDDWDLSAAKGDPGRDGGVIAIPFTFDGSATGNTDPGAGKLRLGPGASQYAATVWRVNPVDSAGLDWTGTITDLAGGTSAIKCAARLYRVADQTKRIVANVTAINTMSGYFNLILSSTSGDTNPFTNGEAFVLVLDRNGDKGDMPVMTAASVSSVTVGTGTKTFAVAAGLSFVAGQRLRAVNADLSKVMVGAVLSYSGTSLALDVDYLVGAGTDNSWTISITGDRGASPTITGSSASSVAVGLGAKSFTVQTGLALVASQRLRIANAGATRVMVGTVTSYNVSTGALVMSIDDIVGSGTDNAWLVSIAGEKGLTPGFAGTSVSSVAVGTGSKSFTTQTGLAFSLAQRLCIANDDSSKVMTGSVTSYDAGTGALVLSIDEIVGSGTEADWNISVTGQKGAKGDKAAQWRGTYNPATTYGVDDWVGFGGKLFISTQAGTGHQPDTSPTYWDQQIDLSALISKVTVQNKSANYTALPGDHSTLLKFSVGATLALTTAATLGNGWFCYFKVSGGALVIDPDSTEQVDASTTITVPAGGSGILICDGVGFTTFLIGGGGGSLSSIVENVKTVDYTVVAADQGKMLTANKATAIAFTLLTTANAGAAFNAFYKNIGVGTLTITGVESIEVNGIDAASLSLEQGEQAAIFVAEGGTKWRALIWRSEGHIEPETDVATAATMDIGATNTERVRATGTTAVTSFGARRNKRRRIRWTGAVTVTHNGTSLIIPGAPPTKTTANGDIWVVESDASGNWRVVSIQQGSAARAALTANLSYYVRADLGAATVTLATPGVWTLATHGLQNDDPIVFSIKPDLALATITAASPAVVTRNLHGYVSGQPVKFSSTGYLPTGITAGTTYYVIATGLTTNTFQISATVGGAAIATTPISSSFTNASSTITSGATHGLVVGQLVRFAGSVATNFTAGVDYYVLSVPTGTTFTVSATNGGSAITAGSTVSGGTVVQTGSHYVEKTGALPTGVVAGTVYFARNVATNTFEFAATAGGASIATSGSQSGIFNVATGNDNNTGLAATRGQALLTAQKGLNLTAASDISIYDVDLYLADSMYLDGATASAPWVGAGNVSFNGNYTYPSNVKVNPAVGSCFAAAGGAFIRVGGMELRGQFGLLSQRGSRVYGLAGLRFGVPGNYHVYANGGQVILFNDYAIIGGAQVHILADGAGQVSVTGLTIPLVGVPTFSVSYVNGGGVGSSILGYSCTFNGSATGTRFITQQGALVNSNGGGASYFPGNAAGLGSNFGVNPWGLYQ